MLKKIALAVLVLIVLFCGYVATRPADYLISREITIHAPAEKIFPYLNNMKMSELWSPWVELDPQATMTYTGPADGVGSKMAWESGEKLGTGSATITESVQNQRVGFKLEYTKPMTMSQEGAYELKSNGDQTTMVWSVWGKNNFLGRMMSLFVNMDKMVGGTFEKGLSKLKSVVESK